MSTARRLFHRQPPPPRSPILELPCTVYSWPEREVGDVKVIHLVSLETRPTGLRVYKGNDERGEDWEVSSSGSEILPSWIHIHPPARKDASCPTCLDARRKTDA